MSKASCVTPPPNDRFLTIFQWQINFCRGNHCAAAILSVLINFHDFVSRKRGHNTDLNDMAEAHGDARSQDESLYQFHSVPKLAKHILDLYGQTTIKKAIKLLQEDLKVITVCRNPNPHYRFDNMNHFILHPEVCQDWLNVHYFSSGRPVENDRSMSQNCSLEGMNEAVSEKKDINHQVIEQGQKSLSPDKSDCSTGQKRPVDAVKNDRTPVKNDRQPAKSDRTIQKTNNQNPINKNNNNIIFNFICSHAPSADKAMQYLLAEALSWLRASGLPEEVVMTREVVQALQGWIERGLHLVDIRSALTQLTQHGVPSWDAVNAAFERVVGESGPTKELPDWLKEEE